MKPMNCLTKNAFDKHTIFTVDFHRVNTLSSLLPLLQSLIKLKITNWYSHNESVYSLFIWEDPMSDKYIKLGRQSKVYLSLHYTMLLFSQLGPISVLLSISIPTFHCIDSLTKHHLSVVISLSPLCLKCLAELQWPTMLLFFFFP